MAKPKLSDIRKKAKRKTRKKASSQKPPANGAPRKKLTAHQKQVAKLEAKIEEMESQLSLEDCIARESVSVAALGRYKLFVANMIRFAMDAPQAYLATYDQHKTMNWATARACSGRLLAKATVRRLLWEATSAVARRNEVSQDFVLEVLRHQSMGNIADYVETVDSGMGATVLRIKDFSELPEYLQRNVKKLKVKTRYVPAADPQRKEDGEYDLEQEVQLDLYDAQAAAVHIGKHLGMFMTREVSDAFDIAAAIREGNRRVEALAELRRVENEERVVATQEKDDG